MLAATEGYSFYGLVNTRRDFTAIFLFFFPDAINVARIHHLRSDCWWAKLLPGQLLSDNPNLKFRVKANWLKTTYGNIYDQSDTNKACTGFSTFLNSTAHKQEHSFVVSTKRPSMTGKRTLLFKIWSSTARHATTLDTTKGRREWWWWFPGHLQAEYSNCLLFLCEKRSRQLKSSKSIAIFFILCRDHQQCAKCNLYTEGLMYLRNFTRDSDCGDRASIYTLAFLFGIFVIDTIALLLFFFFFHLLFLFFFFLVVHTKRFIAIDIILLFFVMSILKDNRHHARQSFSLTSNCVINVSQNSFPKYLRLVS